MSEEKGGCGCMSVIIAGAVIFFFWKWILLVLAFLIAVAAL